MRQKASTLLILTLLFTVILSIRLSATNEGDYGTVTRGTMVVACLLKIIEGVYPVIVLAMIVLGGLRYLTSAGDTQDRIMGKKMVTMAITGGLLVLFLFHISCNIGYDGNTICPADCQGYTPPPSGPRSPSGSSTMNSPPASGTLTTSN